MEKFEVTIEGLVPLLQHRFSGGGELPPEAKHISGNIDYSSEAENALYRMEDGTIYQPADHIENCLVKAAGNFQISGKGKKTYKDLVKAAVLLSPVYIPHEIQDYQIDLRPVRVQKARIIRQRPIFSRWRLNFLLEITEPQLPGKVVKEILDYGGRYVGIGDFRPKFGRFHVTHWQAVKV